jgi:hypothetical protein
VVKHRAASLFGNRIEQVEQAREHLGVVALDGDQAIEVLRSRVRRQVVLLREAKQLVHAGAEVVLAAAQLHARHLREPARQ